MQDNVRNGFSNCLPETSYLPDLQRSEGTEQVHLWDGSIKKTQSFWRSLCDFNSCTIHIFWYLLRRCHMDSHDVTSQYSNFECRGQHVFHPATSKSPTILPTSNSITLLWKIWNRGKDRSSSTESTHHRKEEQQEERATEIRASLFANILWS